MRTNVDTFMMPGSCGGHGRAIRSDLRFPSAGTGSHRFPYIGGTGSRNRWEPLEPVAPLKALIDQQVQVSTVTTISRTVERLAETLAEEMLRDPLIRADLQRVVREAFKATVQELQAEHKKSARGKKTA